MGAVLRKPVSADNWDSLYTEAGRLLESSTVLLRHGGSQQQMRDVYAQAKMISRMCMATLQQYPRHPLTPQRAEWLRDWYSRVEENYNTFQALRRQNLERVDELEERLLD